MRIGNLNSKFSERKYSVNKNTDAFCRETTVDLIEKCKLNGRLSRRETIKNAQFKKRVA